MVCFAVEVGGWLKRLTVDYKLLDQHRIPRHLPVTCILTMFYGIKRFIFDDIVVSVGCKVV